MGIRSVTDISPEAHEAAERSELGVLEHGFALIPLGLIKDKADVGNRLYAFRNGLVRHDAGKGAAPQVFGWDQIETTYQSRTREFRNGRYSGTKYRYQFIRADGAELRLQGGFIDPMYASRMLARRDTRDEQRYADLGDAACNRIAQTKLPAAIRAIEEGTTLSFGKITISSAGVHTKQGVVPWQDLNGLQVHRGTVVIRKENKFLSLTVQQVGSIPNFPLFYALADAMYRRRN
jgi:hypothetical protein